MSFESMQVHGLFNQDAVDDMLARLRRMAGEKWEEDDQVPGCYSKLRPLDNYLMLLQGSVTQVLGCELVPVRSYARIYVEGSVLRPHMDTLDIPYGVSVCLSRGAKDWPFKVGEFEYVDRVGSGVVYDGSIKHYRRGKSPGEQVQVFFHYARKA